MKMSLKIEIVKNEKDFLVIKKCAGLPSAPLSEGEDSALTQAVEMFPEIRSVVGRKAIEFGLLHRIDTETEGVLLIAKNQAFYDKILEEQKQGGFIKTYEARVERREAVGEGWPNLKEALGEDVAEMLKNDSFPKIIEVVSRFRFFGEKNREVRPVFEGAGKAANKKASPKVYTTEIIIEKNASLPSSIAASGGAFESSFVAKCKITEGFRHQVRCHLAFLGFPVVGDKVYNPNVGDGRMMFFATELEW